MISSAGLVAPVLPAWVARRSRSCGFAMTPSLNPSLLRDAMRPADRRAVHTLLAAVEQGKPLPTHALRRVVSLSGGDATWLEKRTRSALTIDWTPRRQIEAVAALTSLLAGA